MDQSAFRNLLSSGASQPASYSSSSARSKSKSRGVLGGPAPKRGTPGTAGGGAWGIKVKPGNEYRPPPAESSTDFAPRNQHKRKYGEAKEGDGKYMDRAERRRKGLDDEYKPVEQLLEDLEKRQQDEGVDEKEIEKQRAYLGGDATHSILVKGLDYALLARTKAELAAKGEEVADEELDELVRGAQTKTKKPVKEEPKTEDKLAKGFKSIAAKDDATKGETGEKKKKKKKKVKPVEEFPSGPILKEEPTAGPSRPKSPDPIPAVTKVEANVTIPEPVDGDDDIFGDAGGYDLTAGRVDEDDSEEEEGEDREANGPDSPRGGSGSHSENDGPTRMRTRSRSYDRPARPSERSHRDRSRSRDRYDYRDRSREYRQDRSGSRDRYDDRRRERSYSSERYGDRDRNSRYDGERSRRERSVSRGYDGRHRDASYDRNRYERRDDRSTRGDRRRGNGSYSPDRRPIRRASPLSRRSPSPSRPTSGSSSPDAKRPRRATRSPSPIRFDYNPRAASLTPSDESEDEHLVGGKLQPLRSSALADVKGYLSLDAEAAADDERKARKAKWRAKQGLGLQDGAERYLEREVGDAEKANRDYVKLMSKLKKDEPGKE